MYGRRFSGRGNLEGRLSDDMPLQFATSEPPHRFRPAESVVQLFLEHVRRTAEPETFPTISHSMPRADSRPIFLRRFDVDRKKRPNGDMAPCPICSPNDAKFLNNGYLVWYPDEGVIRAIGPECGDTVFGGDQYAKALVQRFVRAQRRAETSWAEPREVLARSLPWKHPLRGHRWPSGFQGCDP